MISLDQFKTVAVVGAGTMGQGIAQVTAMNGYRTLLFDVKGDILDQAVAIISKNLQKGIEKNKVSREQKDQTLANIIQETNIENIRADLIIEAVIEDLKVKQELFMQLEMQNEENTILTTNTSSIPVSRIASALKRPQKFAGIHFFNPAHIMKLVEIISGSATEAQVCEALKKFAESLGKIPVSAQDSPGFIVNRVARHYYVESLRIIEEKIADHETIDKLLESSGFKMGPFRLMDLIGVDTNYSVTESIYNSFNQNPKFRPSHIQKQKIDAGLLGKKSGEGFYKY